MENCCTGMPGFDDETVSAMREVEAGIFLKISQTITAKSVASPYFSANQFSFAYANA